MSARRQFGTIRKLPSGRWQARHPDHTGKLVNGPTTFSARADAARYLAHVQADQERGQWRDPRPGKVTFGAWVETWLTSNPAKRATTLARDRTVLRTHALPLLGDRALTSITPVDVKALVDQMASKVAPNTVRTNVAVIRAVFNAAVEADVIPRSPVRQLRLKSAEPRRRPTLTIEELLRLADAIGPRYHALVLVAGVMGLRWSEAIGLRAGDIDFEGRTLTVSQTISEVQGRLTFAPTKSHASRRTLSVPQFVLDDLEQHLARRERVEAGDLVFVGPGGGILRRSFARRAFTPAVASAGLDRDLTFHGLRHVAASLLVEAGEHPRVIQRRLGHATARLSLELYAHVPEAADRRVADHLDEAWTTASAALIDCH